MATSGSFQTIFSTGYALVVEWAESNVNVTNNTSDITVTAILKTIKGTYHIDSTANKTVSLTIDGTTYSGTCTVGIAALSSKTLFTKTVTGIAHNATTGEKSVSISCTLGIKVNINSEYVSSVSTSGTATLTTIPRVSVPTLSASSVEMGKALTIYTNRADGAGFTHKIQYAWGGATFVDIKSDVTDSHPWTVPITLANAIPNNVSGRGTIRCITYSGSTQLGYRDIPFEATVPASVVPTCYINASDPTGIWSNGTFNYMNLVKGLSKLRVQIEASGAYGSTIRSYSVTVGNNTYSDSDITTDYITESGTITITAKVVDSRGRPSTVVSETHNVLDYHLPTITSLSVHRCKSATDGTEDGQGEYVRVNFSADIANINNRNTANYQLVYTKLSTGTASDPITLNTTSYTPTDFSYIFPAVTDSSYEVKIIASDNHNSTTKTTSASTGYTLVHYGKDGRSIGIGKIAENTDTMDVAMELRTEQGVTNVQNGITNRIYSPNENYTWYETTAKHYFNTDVCVKGNIYAGSSYNTKVVLAGETVDKSVKSTKAEYLTAADNRSTNQSPEWYMTTYGAGAVYEFKSTASIGFTNASSTYCSLHTIIPWMDRSGGFPQQYAFFNGEMWKRTGSSITAWGAWRSVLDSASTIDADTLGGYAPSTCYNYCDSLYSGSLAKGASTTVALNSKYSGYIVMGKTTASSAICSIFIPRWCINTTKTLYQYADEAGYVSFYVSHNGTNVTIARQNQTNANSVITGILGVS